MVIKGIIVGSFGILICLGAFVTIMGHTSNIYDCSQLTGYNEAGKNDKEKFPVTTWAGTCHNAQNQAQHSSNILLMSMLVIAVPATLVVSRML